MINLDVSKLVPARFHDYVGPLFPGLFFEISVALANPKLTQQLLANSAQGLWSNRYLTILIGLFIAFAVGFGAFLFVSLLAWFFVLLGRLLKLFWGRCCALVFLPIFRRYVSGKPSCMKYSAFHKVSNYLNSKAFPLRTSAEFDLIQRCWIRLARELLKKRYGVEAEHEDWNVLYWTLAVPKREELKESITMLASHASGWCGIAATYFAPALKSKWYLAFCVLLIVNGLIYKYYDAKRRFTPEGRGYMNVRALLREFGKAEDKSLQ